MEKIVRLISILDDEVINKLIYLDRLVRLYSKFLNIWRASEVTSDGRIVRVKFFRITKYGYENFTERIFPIEDIEKRIASYKRKIKIEFERRHENLRLIQEKRIHSWKKYIDNAEI